MLPEEDYNTYYVVGSALALICFDTTSLCEVLKSHGQSLEKFQREDLIEEFICFRIAFVADVVRISFKGSPNKILMNAFSTCIRQNLGENSFPKTNHKINEYREIPINEFLIDVLLENSGLTSRNFKVSDKSALKFFIESDIKRYIRYTEEILKITLAEPDGRSKKLKHFNEHIGKDFERAHLFLNDELKNKDFDSEISKSGCLFFFAAITLIFCMIFGFASLNSKNVEQSPPITANKKSNEGIEENTQPKKEYSAPKKETKNTQSKEKIEPIPKSGVYTGYDYSQEVLNNDGLCEFTVDNTRNDMPVYVRIWDMNFVRPVRAFTIAQGEKFTARNLSPGRYEVRYRELYENDIPPFGSKSEIFHLEQSETFSGISYSVMELTLYKVVGGNTRTMQIDANDV